MDYLKFCLFVILFFTHCKTPEKEASAESPILSEEIHTDDPYGDFETDYLTGRFDPVTHPDFVQIDSSYADRTGMYLRKDAYQAFESMYRMALQDDIHLQIRSATRNFEYQKGIWERKWTGETLIESGKDASLAYPDPVERAKMILKYSSMPGSSRHHWGTDIDLNSFENTWFEQGAGKILYAWLQQHAHKYGFCQPYTEKGPDRREGYEEEKWHWSYIPVAEQLTKLAKDNLKDQMISGFSGAETAGKIQVVKNYVLGINPECMVYQ
jgi:LAS superfamily LD-carboxypeptidase LdcB